jgi:Helix-turn-helix domain
VAKSLTTEEQHSVDSTTSLLGGHNAGRGSGERMPESEKHSPTNGGEMNNWEAVNVVMANSKSAGTDRLVLIAIARHINRDTGDCYPSKTKIAALANCHPDQVRKSTRGWKS